MEQRSNIDSVMSQMEKSSDSPPQKRTKRQTDIHQPETTSSNSGEPDIHLAESGHSNQQPTKPNDIATGQPLKDGI